MEVVAAISSIAGLLTLLGESIGGTRKLLDFVFDISSASSTVQNFISDINSFLQNLQAVYELVEKLPEDFTSSQIATLHGQLTTYNKDIGLWLNTAKALRPASEVGAKAWFKKFWIAASIKPLGDVRDELDRHNQAVSLSLALLGRTMDISAGRKLNNIDSKIHQGTVASLSKIQEQSAILANIEAYSEAGMHSSAASVRSLQSIATSLSKIETMASSAVSVSVSQNADGIRPRSWNKRRNTGDFQARSHRKSGSYSLSKHLSGSSVKSSPVITRRSQTRSSLLDGGHISEASWESQSKVSDNEEAETVWPGPVATAITLHDEPDFDRSLHKQYQGFHSLTQRLAAVIHPAAVLEYMSLVQVIRDYESKISVLNLLNFGCDLGETIAVNTGNELCESDLSILQQQRDALQARLATLCDQLRLARRRCILQGHSLYEIDQRFGLLNHGHTHAKFREQDPDSHFSQSPQQAINQVLGNEDHHLNTQLLNEWTTKRDRINRWLLHGLISDSGQAQVHISMLAESPPDHTLWAVQTVKHWFLDEAATDGELHLSLSVGAVDSHTIDAPERIVEVTGAVTTKSLRGFDFV